MSPAVSIVVPTYNRLEYLRGSLASVFAQTFQDWEMLIADDGSSEETLAYLRSLGDSRVRLMQLPHSGRPSVARNAGLGEARGEFIAFLDSDDRWLPGKLQAQLDSIRRHPDRGWGHTRYVLVDESGNPTEWARRTGGWPTPEGWILEALVRSETVIALPSVLVRRTLLDRAGGFDEELVMSEDYELWLRLAALSEIDAVTETLTLVLRHQQHSGNEITAFRDTVRAFDKLLLSGSAAGLDHALRKERAAVSGGLARSYAASGQARNAMTALAESFGLSWRYPKWWLRALETTARVVLR
jgi:glycosyltransferase involved in cell wall biosynthesis